MNKKYVCSICGKEYDNLTAYMACVSKCGEIILQEQKEAEQKKRLEEVNAYLNRIKEAEKYLADIKKEFKNKFPEEYELNFPKKESCKCNCHSESDLTQPEEQFKDISISYVDNGKDKPQLSAKVNGVKVAEDSIGKLLENSEVPYLAKLLRMI